MANIQLNTESSLDSLPPEVLYLILEHLFSETQLQVSRHPYQLQPTVIVRRWPLDNTLHHLNQYQPHPLGFVSQYLAGVVTTYAQRSVPIILSSTPSEQIQHLSPTVFGHIHQLSLTMTQATDLLYVTVPALPQSHERGPPLNTPLHLVSVPRIQRLEIHWTIRFPIRLDPQNPADDPIQTAILRLQYFRRSFELRILLAIDHRDGYRVGSGSIIDGVTTIEWLPQSYLYALHQRAIEANIRHFTRTNSRELRLRGDVRLRTIVVEAHPNYDFVPLGWINGLTTVYFPARRSTPRPVLRLRNNGEEGSESEDET